MATLNANPTVYHAKDTNTASLTKRRHVHHALLQLPGAENDGAAEGEDESSVDPWTAEEVFELIRHINDPEHPLTLEQLRVAQLENVAVVDEVALASAASSSAAAAAAAAAGVSTAAASVPSVSTPASSVHVQFTPTIPHCSMATLIGLCLRVKLLRSLPARFKVRVSITPGGHASETDINKQLADKERVAAALENHTLLDVVNKCILEPEESAAMPGEKPQQQNRPAPPFAA